MLKLHFAVAISCVLAATAGLLALGPAGTDSGLAVVRALSHWDSGWYLNISSNGYFYRGPTEQSPVAFFPGFPLMIRAVAVTGLDRTLAGELLSLLCGLGAMGLFGRWEQLLRARLSLPPGRTGAWVLALYPMSFYLYGVLYADAAALLLTIAAFLAVERDRPLLSGLLGALATLCRPVAPALVVGLLVLSLDRRRNAGLRVRWVDWAPALAVGGFLAYLGFLQVSFGDAFAFTHVQAAPGWDQPQGLSTWAKLSFFRTLFPQVAPLVAVRLVGHALAAMLGLALCVPTWRRLGRGYGIYCLLAVGLPALASKDFHSLARYEMAAFPLFLTLGLLLDERPRARRPWLVSSGALLLILAFAFGSGAYVA